MGRSTLALLVAGVALGAVMAGAGTRRPVKAGNDAQQVTVAGDTVAVAEGSVALTGYDKALRSSHESITVTNNTTDTVRAVQASIVYMLADGAVLHRREVWLNGPFVPGTPRRVEFKSWDRQHAFHYTHTRPLPRNATLYGIRVKPVRAVK